MKAEFEGEITWVGEMGIMPNRRTPYVRFVITTLYGESMTFVAFGPLASRVFKDVCIGMQVIVRGTKHEDETEWRAKNAYFPELPESFDEYVERKYGSWSKYNKWKDALRAAEATAWLACWDVDRKRDVDRTSDYSIYGAFSLVTKARPLTAYECVALLSAYKKALDHQDDLRIELKTVKAMLDKVTKGAHRPMIDIYTSLSIDKTK